MRQTIIIGGGAAGMAAAIAAARAGDSVTVLERNRKPLKKLGVTGNGRGNLLNCGQPDFYGDRDFALAVMRHMPYAQTAAFLESCGIPLVHEDEGRMYPSSYLAASAVDAIRLTAERLGVAIVVSTRVTEIERQPKGGFRVHALRSVYGADTVLKSGRVKPGALIGEEPVQFAADRVIVAAGGAAAPMHGTDGTAYGLLAAHGHAVTPIRPALCALLTETRPLEGLSGQRVRASLTLEDAGGNLLHASAGEALFADDGVSGIAAMQLARFASPGCSLHMDLRLAVCGNADADAEAWLLSRAQYLTADTLLVGAASAALAAALWRKSGFRPSLDSPALRALSQVIRRFSLSVTGTRGFDSAQVTSGGVSTADFDPATMHSRLCPGLYAAGEMLDVDGGCGGHNLMFAFSSGLLAGRG